ncbi:hypothetical protein F5148DRAFT_1154517 [Russula earlei]|uniref:Uncharacterized protein n=1 Tax=Russula earlei TaxID=71964 RepID=A0ACC0TSY0_9AGAM|nr:hypothetical protein F5148DRAFT_1154517 [Russula earlei]
MAGGAVRVPIARTIVRLVGVTVRWARRVALRAQTDWVDEQIEGFRIMLDRDPKLKEKTLARHEFAVGFLSYPPPSPEVLQVPSTGDGTIPTFDTGWQETHVFPRGQQPIVSSPNLIAAILSGKLQQLVMYPACAINFIMLLDSWII